MDLINKKTRQLTFKRYCIPGIILIAIPLFFFIFLFSSELFVQPEEIIRDCLLTLFLIAMMIFGILLLILFLSGYYKTTFYKSLEEQAIELDEIGNDIEHASKYSSVFVGQKFCILFATDVHVIRLSDIVFMYSDDYVIKDKAWEETTRYSEIVIYDRKKVKYCCIVKKKKDADNILTDIFKMVPYVINGYSDYRFDMLENDFNGMLFDVDYNKEHMMNGWDKYENNSIS